MATTDAAAQGLAACQAGPAFGAARYDWVVPAGLPVGAAVGQVQATDAGGGTVSYALTAGNDAGVFKLDATTGILSVAGALPAGGAGLTVTATDSPGGRDERAGGGGGGRRGPAAGAARVSGRGLDLPRGGGRAGGHGGGDGRGPGPGRRAADLRPDGRQHGRRVCAGRQAPGC